MPTVALVIAIIAVLYARSSAVRGHDLEQRLGELRRSMLAREAELEELQQTLTFLHKVAERLAGGGTLDALMVREKRLFAQVTTTELQAALQAGEQPYVIDVRGQQEWAVGHIPGALHLPLDDFEKTLHAVRRDGCKIHVICAMGSRSEVAAALLAERGYLNVHNVQGGMKAWRGEVVRD